MKDIDLAPVLAVLALGGLCLVAAIASAVMGVLGWLR